MRLVKAEISGFGKWQQTTIEFLPENQLFFGGNEAGKSTLYQFILAMLFGFPTKSKKRQDYTPKSGGDYGGFLWLTDESYGEIKIERFRQKNRGKAQVTVGEQVGDDRLLEKLLAPLNKEIFQQVFTFQQEQLSQLEDLKENQLHDSLMALGISGSQKLMLQREKWLQSAQGIYKRKGQKQELNQALLTYEYLQQRLTEKQAEEASFQQIFQEEEQVQTRLKQQQKQLEQQEASFQQLQQQELQLPLYEELQQLQQEAVVVKLTEADEQDLKAFYQEYQQLTNQIETLTNQLAKYSGLDQHSAKYFFYLETETELNQLLAEEGQFLRWDERQQVANQQVSDLHNQLTELTQAGQFTEESELLTETEVTHWQATQESWFQKQQQAVMRSEILEEQQRQLEAEVTAIEERYPELLSTSRSQKKDQQPAKWGLLVALVAVVGSFFVPLGGRILLLTVALAGMGWFFWRQRKPQQAEAEKLRWQEKLGQLDVLAAQYQENLEGLQQLNREAQQSQQAFSECLKEKKIQGDINQLPDIYARQQQAMLIKEQLADIEIEGQRYQAYQQQLAQKFAFLEQWLPLQEKSLLEQFELVKEYKKEMANIQFAQTHQENAVLSKQKQQYYQQQQILLADHQDLFARVGIQYPTEIPEGLAQTAKQQQRQKRKAELTEMLGELFQRETSSEQLALEKVQLTNQLAETKARITLLQEQQQRLLLQLEGLQKDGTLDSLYQTLQHQKEVVTNLLVEWGSYQVAAQLVSDVTTELSDQQLPQLLQQASHYLGILTNGEYQEVVLIDGILAIEDQRRQFSLYELSTGTKDQLIMAIRFAYLSLQNTRCPIIIDDGWLHYDSLRKKQLARLLVEFKEKYQVICFSSDQEMVSYYRELNQPVIEL